MHNRTRQEKLKKERNVAATPKVHRLICHRSEKKSAGKWGKMGKNNPLTCAMVGKWVGVAVRMSKRQSD